MSVTITLNKNNFWQPQKEVVQLNELVKIAHLKRIYGVVTKIENENKIGYTYTLSPCYNPAPKSVLNKKRNPFSKHYDIRVRRYKDIVNINKQI